MTHVKYCAQCGVKFEANRIDAKWCSGKCAAKFYRDNPNPEYIHAEKDHIHWFECDQCHQAYTVNDYAKRGGKRTPRFCSVKCKQAAWRYSQKEQAARRQEQETRPGGQPPPGSGNGTGQGKRQQSGGSGQQHRQERQSAGTAGGWPKGRDPYKILGIFVTATAQEITAAWRKKISEYHPDKNGDTDTTAYAQDINWAYDFLMPKDKKTKRRSKRF